MAVSNLQDGTVRMRATTGLRASDVSAVALAAGALGFAYLSSFRSLLGQWDRDPNFSYGYFVAPIAAAIAWSRRGAIDRSKIAPRWWAFAPLLAVVALRFPLYEWNEQYIETATIPLVVACLVLALGGWHLLRVALPAVLFLFFMLPLPPSINAMLSHPLQRVATLGSLTTLQAIGMPVIAEGNVLFVGEHPLEVARACNGLSMLLSFITLITATVLLIRPPVLETLILLASAIPIAVVSNVVRITATALAYHAFGKDVAETYAHTYAGWAMMPFALLLVWLEFYALSRLFVEVETVDAAALLHRGRGPVPRAGV